MTKCQWHPMHTRKCLWIETNLLTMEGQYDKPVQASGIITVFKALVENQEDIKCMAKVNLEEKPPYEISFKDYATKAAVKAMIGDQIKLKDLILKCSENRDVKDTSKIPLTAVIIYEAPYELDDMHIYRILSKYGDLKGNITRHKHKY